MKVSLIDYGAGNLLSVRNAVENCGFDADLVSTPDGVLKAQRLILPGVGAFSKAMEKLHCLGLVGPLNQAVNENKVPILGICLGMQLMAKRSDELGGAEGLGWFDADVVRIRPLDGRLKVPHVGWNQVQFREGSPLFAGVGKGSEYYFVHSFHMEFKQDALEREATTDYGGPVTAAVRKGHVFATQFHPEKSSGNGLKVLENFLRWSAC